MFQTNNHFEATTVKEDQDFNFGIRHPDVTDIIKQFLGYEIHQRNNSNHRVEVHTFNESDDLDSMDTSSYYDMRRRARREFIDEEIVLCTRGSLYDKKVNHKCNFVLLRRLLFTFLAVIATIAIVVEVSNLRLNTFICNDYDIFDEIFIGTGETMLGTFKGAKQIDYSIIDNKCSGNDIGLGAGEPSTIPVTVPGIWYIVNGTGNRIMVSTCNDYNDYESDTSTSLANTHISVLRQSSLCSSNSLECLISSTSTSSGGRNDINVHNDFGSNIAQNNKQVSCLRHGSSVVWDSLPGETYRVLVHGIPAAHTALDYIGSRTYIKQDDKPSEDFVIQVLDNVESFEEHCDKLDINVLVDCIPSPGFSTCDEMQSVAMAAIEKQQQQQQKCTGGAVEMSFVYMGGPCQINDNNQNNYMNGTTGDRGKGHFRCVDSQVGPGFLDDTGKDVYIVVTDTDDLSNVYFEGFVRVGEQFSLRNDKSNNKNYDKNNKTVQLLSEYHTLRIFNSSDIDNRQNLIQHMEYYASCGDEGNGSSSKKNIDPAAEIETTGNKYLNICDTMGGVYLNEFTDSQQTLLRCYFNMNSYNANVHTSIDIPVPRHKAKDDDTISLTKLAAITGYEPIRRDLTSAVRILIQSKSEYVIHRVNFTTPIDMYKKLPYNLSISLTTKNKFGFECTKNESKTYSIGI